MKQRYQKCVHAKISIRQTGNQVFEPPWRIFKGFSYVFGLQLNIFMSVGILVQYFRCKLLKSE